MQLHPLPDAPSTTRTTTSGAPPDTAHEHIFSGIFQIFSTSLALRPLQQRLLPLRFRLPRPPAVSLFAKGAALRLSGTTPRIPRAKQPSSAFQPLACSRSAANDASTASCTPAVGPSGPGPAYSALHSTCTSALLAPADRARPSTAASSASRLKPHVYSKSSCPWQPRPSRTVAVYSKPALQRPASVFLLQQQRQQKQQQDLLQ